jgi:putative flippase GtrA
VSTLRQLRAALPTAVCALCVDASVLQSLVSVGGWHYLAAATAGFAAGVLVSWVLSVRCVFTERRFRSPALELTLFAVIGVVGLLLNDLVIALAVESLRLHYLVGKACAATATFAFNFGVRRALLYSRSALPALEAPEASFE